MQKNEMIATVILVLSIVLYYVYNKNKSIKQSSKPKSVIVKQNEINGSNNKTIIEPITPKLKKPLIKPEFSEGNRWLNTEDDFGTMEKGKV